MKRNDITKIFEKILNSVPEKLDTSGYCFIGDINTKEKIGDCYKGFTVISTPVCEEGKYYFTLYK